MTADDLCSGAVDVTFSDVETTLDACTYQVVRTFSAEDDCGNTSHARLDLAVRGHHRSDLHGPGRRDPRLLRRHDAGRNGDVVDADRRL